MTENMDDYLRVWLIIEEIGFLISISVLTV